MKRKIANKGTGSAKKVKKSVQSKKITRSDYLSLFGQRNDTAKVIFYSCLQRETPITRIAKLWNYKTSTFFYQPTQAKIISNLEKAKIVSKSKKGYLSDYSEIVSLENVQDYFDELNAEIEIDFIDRFLTDTKLGKTTFWNEKKTAVKDGKTIWEWKESTWVKEDHKLEDADYRKYIQTKYPEIEEKLEKLCFYEEDVSAFYDLWNCSGFKKSFLSNICLKRSFLRSELPDDPINLLFAITINLCYSRYELKYGEPDQPFSIRQGVVEEYIPYTFPDITNPHSCDIMLYCSLDQIQSRLDGDIEAQDEFKNNFKAVDEIITDNLFDWDDVYKDESTVQTTLRQTTESFNNILDAMGRSPAVGALKKVKIGYNRYLRWMGKHGRLDNQEGNEA